jgi:hypothetical protein
MKDQQKKIKISFFSYVAIIFIAIHPIEFGYVSTFYNVEVDKNLQSIGRLIIYIFIFPLPFVFLKLLKIIYLKKIIFYFILWTLFLTSLSFIISKILDFSPEFSNTERTIRSLGGFILGLVLGYYIFKLNINKSKIIVQAIKTSIFFIFIGIAYQFFFLDNDIISSYRLFGLSGEPKGLGISLVPFIIAAIATSKLKINDYQIIVIIIACVVALILTKSFTALLSFVLMILVLIKSEGFLKIKTFKSLIFLFIIFIIVFFNFDLKHMLLDRFFLYLNAEYQDGIQSVFNFPIIGELVVEANELPVILFFKDNPFFIITGVGLGQESIFSYNYINQLGGIGFLPKDYAGYISPNSALIANTANFGLVMILLLAIWAIVLAHKLKDYLVQDKKFIFYFFLSHFLLNLLVFQTSIPLSTSIIVLLSFYFFFKNKKVFNAKKDKNLKILL